MELKWTPEPSPEEREALERALAHLHVGRANGRTAWWHEGVQEAVSPEPDFDAD